MNLDRPPAACSVAYALMPRLDGWSAGAHSALLAVAVLDEIAEHRDGGVGSTAVAWLLGVTQETARSYLNDAVRARVLVRRQEQDGYAYRINRTEGD